MIAVPKRAFDAQVMLQGIRLVRAVGRLWGNRQALLSFEIELTRHLGLFDREHYLAQIEPSELRGMSPLRHYVLIGDAANLSPTPLFDLRHYDALCGRRHVNRLLHYGLVARFRGMSPTPWFDAEYYLQSNPDVAQSGLDALEHFQRWGWREGRSPLPGIDMRRLLGSQPGLRVSKGNPLTLFANGHLAHHLKGMDHREARVPSPPPVVDVADVDMLDPARWAGVQPRPRTVEPTVDVLIPVYGGAQETLRCLYTVLTTPVATPHEVIVINDAGPVPELNAMLRSLAGRGLFTLEQHRANQGFVKTVNHGLRMHRERDVVILNSDTEVYNDWLDRLLRHATEHPRLATVTPLSNNATICSYPETLSDNRLGLEVGHAEIDQMAAAVNPGKHVPTPTGVGFCMYMRREAIRDIGLLDERHFGRGYGEENDFCQRAIRRGWTNAIACDTYVRHVGSVSFKGEAAERTAKAIKTLSRLHPHYEADVARHISDDPAWVYRTRIDLARLKRLKAERNVLLVCHNRGGGTERHLLEQSQHLLAQGAAAFELRPSHEAGCVALLHPGLYGLQNLAALPLHVDGMLEEALRELAITEIHLHHLIDFPSGTAQHLLGAAQRLGLAIRLAVHDYYAVCPRVNLVTPDGRHCGEPTTADCNHCLAQDRLIEQTGPIEAWRAESLHLLSAAQQVVVPSSDVARRLAQMAPQLRVTIEPHEDEPPPHELAPPVLAPGESLRVLVIGAISRIKGYDVVHGLAHSVRARGLPLKVSLLGYSMDDPRLADQGVALLGRYFDNELLEKISAADPHIVLIPSIWPETYCYVLSGALRSGRRIAVFDLGAQAERARRHDPRHLLLPLELATRPDELADRLLATVYIDSEPAQWRPAA
ncbi:glycosyltransferase [Ideonella sp. YS5]|uniref:glycosyltransferase n=1 Tax=Ideonella sp. YS5 TaxID=3453714 RepID=UPI003EEAFDE3